MGKENGWVGATKSAGAGKGKWFGRGEEKMRGGRKRWREGGRKEAEGERERVGKGETREREGRGLHRQKRCKHF